MARNTNYSRNSRQSSSRQQKRAPQQKRQLETRAADTPRRSSFSDYVGAGNDVSWYTGNPQLIADAAKIPFGNQLGRKLEFGPNAKQYTINGVTVKKVQDFVVPGVMGLSMVCVPGLAHDASDGVNIATSLTFQKIRKELSTYAAYAPADIMMYIMGIDSIYTQYANIMRAFGIVNAYSGINLYFPDAILRAGYAFDSAAIADFKANINQYRTQFNNLVYKASTLYLPVDFTITSRHSWLFSNYFVDASTAKAQIYIHKMAGYHQLDETTSTNGTCLMFKSMDTGLAWTMADYLKAFDDCIEAYRNSDSMLKIAADMRRAFGEASYWKLSYIDENYLALPTEDVNVLTQIHNMTVYPTAAFQSLYTQYLNTAEGGFNIYQDVNHNIVLFDPVWKKATGSLTDADKRILAAANHMIVNQVLDFNAPDVGTDLILEGTRNTLVGEVVDDGTNTTFSLKACGADICTGLAYYVRQPDGSVYRYPIAGNYIDRTVSQLSWANMAGLISIISMFNWAPRLWLGLFDSDMLQSETTMPVGQLNNYTTVAPEVLATLNNNIMCSMWSVPGLK